MSLRPHPECPLLSLPTHPCQLSCHPDLHIALESYQTLPSDGGSDVTECFDCVLTSATPA
ncbi:hypothetical protein BD309DRAFT_975924 [Dichomitus squalens]|nr:hypothetical protein BD309DRAFT_975924 [Dichomitus squalens]